MKRHTVTVSMGEEHSDLQIAAFLKLAQSFDFKVRSELKAATFDMATISYSERHCQLCDVIKTPEFIRHVNERPLLKVVRDEERAVLACIVKGSSCVNMISNSTYCFEWISDK